MLQLCRFMVVLPNKAQLDRTTFSNPIHEAIRDMALADGLTLKKRQLTTMIWKKRLESEWKTGNAITWWHSADTHLLQEPLFSMWEESNT